MLLHVFDTEMFCAYAQDYCERLRQYSKYQQDIFFRYFVYVLWTKFQQAMECIAKLRAELFFMLFSHVITFPIASFHCLF